MYPIGGFRTVRVCSRLAQLRQLSCQSLTARRLPRSHVYLGQCRGISAALRSHEFSTIKGQTRAYSGCACHGSANINRKQKAYIALGSNMGDRVGWIEKACNEMDRRGIRVKRTSSLWETEPMYYMNQDRFMNGACEVRH